MKAIVQTKYGAAEEVFEVKNLAKPSPKAHEVLIRIHATTATGSDRAMRLGEPYIGRLYTGLNKPKRAVPGVECAGVIEAVGKDVTLFKVGDEVVAETADLGCYAEYVCIAETGLLLAKPANMTFEEVAPVCAGAVTALNFFKIAKIQAGQKVLIYGASGSVGTYAIQIAKALGTEVTGVCSGRNTAMVKELGADEVIDYTQEDFTKSNKTYDIIFDAVGKGSFTACKPLLNKKGVYLSVDLSSSLFWQILKTSITGGKKAKFSATGALPVTKRLPLLKEIKEMIEAGKLKSVIDKRYTLENTAQAHSYVDTGRKRGNVVIVP